MARLNYKDAVAKKCKDGIYDPLHHGRVKQQIATCVQTDCPLHSVRPINKKFTILTKELLKKYGITADDLDDRARELLVPDDYEEEEA